MSQLNKPQQYMTIRPRDMDPEELQMHAELRPEDLSKKFSAAECVVYWLLIIFYISYKQLSSFDLGEGASLSLVTSLQLIM